MAKKNNTITYKWIVSSMDCVIHKDGLSNVVNMIHWRRSAEEGIEGEADYYYTDVYGALPVTLEDPTTFIPYENLTETDVEGWLNEMTEPTPAEMDAQLLAALELLKNPVEETLPLPWING